jgi:hypothetical protein
VVPEALIGAVNSALSVTAVASAWESMEASCRDGVYRAQISEYRKECDSIPLGLGP